MRPPADVPRLSWLPRRAVLLSVALLLLALAAAAVWLWWPPTPAASPAATPNSGASIAPAPTTPAPLFASDEEALAAATAAYARYLDVSGSITSAAGHSSDRIAEFVTADFLPASLEDFAWFAESQVHSVGAAAYDSVSLQSYTNNVGDSASVTLYLCLDVSDVRLIDADGSDVTPPDRQNRLPLEVQVEVEQHDTQRALISRSDLWSGETFCEK